MLSRSISLKAIRWTSRRSSMILALAHATICGIALTGMPWVYRAQRKGAVILCGVAGRSVRSPAPAGRRRRLRQSPFLKVDSEIWKWVPGRQGYTNRPGWLWDRGIWRFRRISKRYSPADSRTGLLPVGNCELNRQSETIVGRYMPPPSPGNSWVHPAGAERF